MKQTILLIAFLLISIGLYDKYGHSQKIDIIPDTIVVPVPEPEPILETNIIHDDLELAGKLRTQFDKKLIIIFGANWCPYCQQLKNDLVKFDTTKYILCLINVDNNKELATKYKLKILPTSILCDSLNNEKSRKTGYIHQDYKIWLDSN